LILVGHIALALWYSLVIPPWEAHDEWPHFRHAAYIAENLALPDPGQRLTTEFEFDEASQPPLYYLLAAAPMLAVDLSDGYRPVVNPYASRGTGEGGVNFVLHDPAAESWPWQGTLLALHLGRLVSVFISTLALVAAWLLLRLLSPARASVALASVGLMAFAPQFVFLSAVMTNDILLVAVETALLYAALVLVRDGLSTRRLLALGAWTALGLLSKYLALAMLPVVLAAILFGARGGLALAGIVSLSFGGLGLAAVRGLLRWSAAGSYLAILALNTVTLALVAGLAAASLVRSLRKALEAGERLRAELAEGKAALEREAEERRGAERLAEFYRDHDGRTGLPNRERFLYELGRAARSAERRKRLLAVLAVGVDEPGRLYDEYGHAASEAALAEAALALKESFREDDLVARFDETHLFVLCENLNDSGDAGELIRKAKGSFARPFRAEGAATAAATDGAVAGPAGAAGPAMAAAGAGMSLSASVGLAFYPHDGAGPEALLEAARAALRLAEESGPGSYRLFDAHLHAGLIARIRYGRELEAAVEEGLLVPWFQPKVDAGRRIVGAEALARWPRDDGPTRISNSPGSTT